METDILEYESRVEAQNYASSEEEDNRGVGMPVEAEEVPENNAATDKSKNIKPKRVIRNPQPKLDPVRLMGTRGIGTLQNTFKKEVFKGKGHEKEDLTLLMKKLEHWAHRLFPKMPFDDTLKQIEKLGTKKAVQVQMKRLRLDMFEELGQVANDDDVERQGNPVNQEAPDAFDELLGSLDSQTSLSQRIQNKKSTVLTNEQRERIEKNKKLAEIKRKQKSDSTAIASDNTALEGDMDSIFENDSSEILKDIPSEQSAFSSCNKPSTDDQLTPMSGQVTLINHSLSSSRTVDIENHLTTSSAEPNNIILSKDLQEDTIHNQQDETNNGTVANLLDTSTQSDTRLQLSDEDGLTIDLDETDVREKIGTIVKRNNDKVENNAEEKI